MTKVYVKVRTVVSPVHNYFRGFRFLVAKPNMAGRPSFNGSPRPSFEKPYLIMASGDLPRITSRMYFALVAKLQKAGYEEVELWSDLEPKPFIKQVKEFPK